MSFRAELMGRSVAAAARRKHRRAAITFQTFTAFNKENQPMRLQAITLAVSAIAVFATSTVHSQRGPQSVTLNATSIKGFPSGEVSLTGGGVFDPSSGFVKLGGSFSCINDVNQGPLANLKQGEGVRWDSDSLLTSTPFKCTGSAGEAPKTAFTDANTVVLRADFYRAGDGVDESFRANMIISAFDLDPVLPGIQNVWVQGVGCGEALVNLR